MPATRARTPRRSQADPRVNADPVCPHMKADPATGRSPAGPSRFPRGYIEVGITAAMVLLILVALVVDTRFGGIGQAWSRLPGWGRVVTVLACLGVVWAGYRFERGRAWPGTTLDDPPTKPDRDRDEPPDDHGSR